MTRTKNEWDIKDKRTTFETFESIGNESQGQFLVVIKLFANGN